MPITPRCSIPMLRQCSHAGDHLDAGALIDDACTTMQQLRHADILRLFQQAALQQAPTDTTSLAFGRLRARRKFKARCLGVFGCILKVRSSEKESGAGSAFGCLQSLDELRAAHVLLGACFADSQNHAAPSAAAATVNPAAAMYSP